MTYQIRFVTWYQSIVYDPQIVYVPAKAVVMVADLVAVTMVRIMETTVVIRATTEKNVTIVTMKSLAMKVLVVL